MTAESIKDKPLSSPKKKTKEIIKLAKNNIPVSIIARACGVSKQNVSETLQRYNMEVQTLNSFKDHRPEILAGIQERTLKTLTDEDIKKASVRDRAILFGTIYDKERLERGQSTAIMQSNQITGSLKDLIELITGHKDTPKDMGEIQDVVVEPDKDMP